ncbi:hypothetical protein [Streptomyces sp. NRRL F-2664]|uniref:hypothetical protein n=1 Tax=Streptomyces sp. NRRL F-2664 TaxID=1463842 RepID=UPI000A6F097E|nr:hypothetical protein [Streptomyces sp. NRRL F-2664]
MADATASHTDPGRAVFTIALNAARDLLIQAAGTIGDTTGRPRRHHRPPGPGPPHARPAHPHPAPRVVKRAISTYSAQGVVDRTSCKAATSIGILTGPTT